MATGKTSGYRIKPGTKENYNSHETREILVQLPLHVVFEI